MAIGPKGIACLRRLPEPWGLGFDHVFLTKNLVFDVSGQVSWKHETGSGGWMKLNCRDI